MAIYHLHMRPVRRREGRSAPAAAAYWSGTKIFDESIGQTIDYTKEAPIEHTEIVLPKGYEHCAWAQDREKLWNLSERAEYRSDSRVARDYEVAVPYELFCADRLVLTRQFARYLADRYQVVVDFSIRKASEAGDSRNIHAHFLTTTRIVEEHGLGKKSVAEWSNGQRSKAGLVSSYVELVAIRQRWAEMTNEHLGACGVGERIDHRTLEAQGIERAPQSHRGVALTALSRKGIKTDVGERLAAEEASEEGPACAGP
jgi:hypothetical protein